MSGVIAALYTRFIEPFIITVNKEKITLFSTNNTRQSLKIVLVTDIQIGRHKKTAWTNKIVEKIEKINPDLIIFGGDLIDNEGASEDESQYLEPLKKL